MRLKVGAWNSCTWRELCLAICRRHEAIMTRGGRSLACSKDSGELRAVTRGCRQRSAPIHVTRRTHQTSEAHRAAFAWTVSDDDRPPVRPSFDLLFGDGTPRVAPALSFHILVRSHERFTCAFFLIGLRNAAHATSENRFTVSAGKSCATEVGARCTHLSIVVVWAKWALALGWTAHARTGTAAGREPAATYHVVYARQASPRRRPDADPRARARVRRVGTAVGAACAAACALWAPTTETLRQSRKYRDAARRPRACPERREARRWTHARGLYRGRGARLYQLP